LLLEAVFLRGEKWRVLIFYHPILMGRELAEDWFFAIFWGYPYVYLKENRCIFGRKE